MSNQPRQKITAKRAEKVKRSAVESDVGDRNAINLLGRVAIRFILVSLELTVLPLDGNVGAGHQQWAG